MWRKPGALLRALPAASRSTQGITGMRESVWVTSSIRQMPPGSCRLSGPWTAAGAGVGSLQVLDGAQKASCTREGFGSPSRPVSVRTVAGLRRSLLSSAAGLQRHQWNRSPTWLWAPTCLCTGPGRLSIRPAWAPGLGHRHLPALAAGRGRAGQASALALQCCLVRACAPFHTAFPAVTWDFLTLGTQQAGQRPGPGPGCPLPSSSLP